MDKEKLGALRWFLQFIQMDFHNLRPGDKAKLLVEAGDYLFPQKEIEENRSSLRASSGLGIELPFERIDPKIFKAIEREFELSPKMDPETLFNRIRIARNSFGGPEVFLVRWRGAQEITGLRSEVDRNRTI